MRVIEREEAIYNLWKKHYEKEMSMAGMSKELGKDESYVRYHISSYERRKALGMERHTVSTHDFQRVAGLDDDTTKSLLSAKAEGKLGSDDLEKFAPILKDASEEKREEIVEGLLESKGFGQAKQLRSLLPQMPTFHR